MRHTINKCSQALPLGAVILAGLAAAQPLLRASGQLPWAADTLIHLHRLVELDHLLRHGYLFPRYAPDLAYGYGFPLFNFYAPLSYYAAEIFRLVGMDFSPALLATLTLFIVGAGAAMYAWAAEFFGQRAGMIAAAAYVTAPYLLYNVYHRGALAEALAMALMPAILWAITRLAQDGAGRFFIPTALLYAALLLGHNITAFIFTPVIVVYAAVMVTQYTRLARTRSAQYAFRIPYSASRVALALLLGLGLSAFFWIPMFLERNSVQIYQLFLPAAFDYRLHFVALGELFSPPVAADPNLVLPPTPRSVGLIPVGLAILALVLRWRRWNRQQQATAGLAAVLALGSLFLTLPQSAAIWNALPILRFIQFPWRFLGLASLAVAFLAGSAFDLRLPTCALRPPSSVFCPSSFVLRPSSFVLRLSSFVFQPSSFVLRSSCFVIIAGLVVYGFTWQYAPYLAPIARPSVADIARYERESGTLGTTSAGDYLPNTVKKLPDANTLVERYSRADVIERLDPASLPSGAMVLASRYRPLSADVTITSPVAFVAAFDIFDFAGWQAQVDGQPIAITPTDPHGLISFPVPAGQHRLQVFFGSTPLRTGAGVVSLACVLVLIAASLSRSKFCHSERSEESLSRGTETLRFAQGDKFQDLLSLVLCADRRPPTADGSPLPTPPASGGSKKGAATAPCGESERGAIAPALVCVLVICLLAWKSFYLDTRETIFRRTRFDGTRVAGVAHPLNVSFDNQIALMGYELEAPRVEMGGSVRVALYWRAARKLDIDYSISAKLVDERGFVYGQRDSQHPGGYPSSRWALTDYARDVHDIAFLPGTPPGDYRLRVGVYRVGAPSGLSVLDANGAPAGTTIDVAIVQVIRPGPALFRSRLATPKPEHPSNAQLAPGLLLLGYDLPQTEPDAGAKLPLTLYWQATASQKRDLQAQLDLISADGATIPLGNVTPISDQFSTSRLLAGDVMRGQTAIRVPALTPGGTYTLRTALVDASGAVQGDTAELGRVTIRVPERRMTPPRVEHSTRGDLGDQVRLIGYDIKSQTTKGAEVVIVLYWQAQREMTNDYKAFVHLLDTSGRLIVSSDAIPANWTRPTTGWITSEYVADPHTLTLPADLPPGDYPIEVGLYDADSNARLGDRVLLDQPITIAP